MSKNAYGISTDDKRIVFMVVGLVLLFVLFLASAAAWTDRTWTPLIITAQVAVTTIFTAVFFGTAIKILWRIAKRLFPND